MHKKSGQIEIRLAGLMPGTHEFDFTRSASFFNDFQLIDTEFTGDIEIKVVTEKSESGIIVTIGTSVTADFTCDICLAPLSKQLSGSFRIYYLYSEHDEESHDGSEEYRSLDRNALSLDMTEDVRETLLLSLPMKVTCSDNPDCHIAGSEKEDDGTQAGDASSWQESLEKLKTKYR